MKKLIYSKEDLDLILSLQMEEKDQEIERLNNIINELEEWLCEEQATYRDYLIRTPKIASDYGERHLTLSNLTKVSDKLQELKGDSSNE